MADYGSYAPTPGSFGRRGAPIVASANDIADRPKAIVCTAAGNVTLVPEGNADSATVVFTGCPVGFVPPYLVRRVTAFTGSWATVLD